MFQGQALQPAGLVDAIQPCPRLLGQGEVELAVGALHCGEFPGFLQPGLGVVLHGVQQPVPLLQSQVGNLNQGLVHQRREQLYYACRLGTCARGDRLGGKK